MKFTSSALLFSLFLSSPFVVHADDQPIASELDGLGPPPPTGFGDPHFRTYDGTKYSFHGQCDLVMARSVSFGNGLGLELHARTEIVTDWSLIKNAALRIGNDTFELANDGSFYFNGSSDMDLDSIHLAGKYPVKKHQIMVEVTKDDVVTQEAKTTYIIELGPRQNIKMNLWKRMISVQVGIHLDDTEGMLGIYDKVGMVGRDRETLAIDANDMGFQWQVQDTEPMLFHDVQSPQFPHQCILPEVDLRQRRLAEVSQDFVQQATDACATVESDLRQFCIEDVLLTRDIHIATGYGVSEGFSF